MGELGKWEISLNVFQLWHATVRNALVKSLSRLSFQFQSKRKMATHTIKAPSAHNIARKTCLSTSFQLDPSYLRHMIDPSAQTKKYPAQLSCL